jgi:hypothetical protein
MGVGALCDRVGVCNELLLNLDDIVENLDKFFLKLVIRALKLSDIKEKVKSLLFSTKVLDIEAWKSLLNEEILNSEAIKTSKKVVEVALEDAKEKYKDQTLPFIILFFLADSDLSTFIDAFKYINLAQNAGETINDVKEVIDTVKSGGILSGIKAGIGLIKKGSEVVKQAFDPNFIKKEDLKTLCSYYINFITLLPVNIIDEMGEFGPVYSNVTKILNGAFDVDIQKKFVEDKIFFKYMNSDKIDVKEFFTDNYETLKKDNLIRRGLVETFIKDLPRQMLRRI